MTVLRVTFLGTSAAQPTLRRGLSATQIRAHSDRLLVDCGEGTQRQMLRFGTGFRLDLVLFTHFHADHYLGIIGFLRTLSMGGRTEPLVVYGPSPFVTRELRELIHVGIGELPYPVELRALAQGDVVARDGYWIRAVGVDHRTPALGYVLEEPPRPGAFDVAAARALGVEPGPLYSALQSGRVVTSREGREVRPEQVLGEPRPGRKLALSGDTRPCQSFIDAARGADLLVHDSTFSREEQARAVETRHSTAFEAGEVAAAAGARQLVLSHLSTRYDTRPHVLRGEAKRAFGGEITVAEDGLALELPLEH
jgi:ribonuclease Z